MTVNGAAISTKSRTAARQAWLAVRATASRTRRFRSPKRTAERREAIDARHRDERIASAPATTKVRRRAVSIASAAQRAAATTLPPVRDGRHRAYPIAEQAGQLRVIGITAIEHRGERYLLRDEWAREDVIDRAPWRGGGIHARAMKDHRVEDDERSRRRFDNRLQIADHRFRGIAPACASREAHGGAVRSRRIHAEQRADRQRPARTKC